MPNWTGQCTATGGGSTEPLDQILCERYGLLNFKGRAIECGANDGLFLSNTLVLEREAGWDTINIEASWPNYIQLIENRKNSTNYFFALSNTNNDRVVIDHYIEDNGGLDKINYFDGVMTKNLIRASSGVVCTIKYDKLINQNIDLMVLDVEGNEIAVIVGMLESPFIPTILCIEHTQIDMDRAKWLLRDKYKFDWSDSLNAVWVKK